MNRSGIPNSVDKLHPLAKQVLDIHPLLQTDTKRLQNGFADQLHDPFSFVHMKAVVERLVRAVGEDQNIIVFADFDTDGIPAAAMLHDLFITAGHANFSVYIPKRDIEGFGLKPEQVTEFIDNETDLLITVDCGIRSHEAINTARDSGVDVVVLDHHVPADELPNANQIINPELPESEYPFADLCGAGVVFKLLQALAEDGCLELPDNFAKGQLGMASVATISDMVPLVDENYVFAKYGLEILRNTNRPGLKALYEKGRIQGRELTEVDVGFTIGSHINAASRLDQPKLAYKLLVTRNYKRGKELAAELHRVYRRRKRKTGKLKQAVTKRLAEEKSSSVVVAGSEDWKPALLGPVANSITDNTGQPAFLWGQANGRTKGSARATRHDVVSMLHAITDDNLEDFGGHKLAGGFSLTATPSPAFTEGLSKVVDQFQIDEGADIDPVPAHLEDLSWSLFQSLQALGPFGVGCEQPLFRVSEVVVDSVRTFGSNDEHVSFTLTKGKNKTESVAFFASDTMQRVTVGDTITVVGALEKTTFGFDKKLRFRMETVSVL
jgi:single-stranded-DNA-specific exonuclease